MHCSRCSRIISTCNSIQDCFITVRCNTRSQVRDIIQDDIAVRYPERWFPSMKQQLFNYMRSGTLVQNDDFAACTKAYYGDLTFEEAYNRTGHAVSSNIEVTPRSRCGHVAVTLRSHCGHIAVRRGDVAVTDRY